MRSRSVHDLSVLLSNLPELSSLTPGSFLRGMPIFSDVDPSVLERVAGTVELCEYEPDEIIARYGKFNERFFLILSGRVGAVIPTEHDPRQEIYTMSSGDFFGEGLVFSDEPRGNSAIAREPVTALAFSHEQLSVLTGASPDFRERLNRMYIDRKLRDTLRSLPLFTAMSGELFERMLGMIEVITVPEDETVFREGDGGDTLYLIQKGEVRIYTGTGS
ncbi:MAG: cyclic nucleotide-binding domain-containing protein, partial [Spirochaetota bacterium]